MSKVKPQCEIRVKLYCYNDLPEEIQVNVCGELDSIGLLDLVHGDRCLIDSLLFTADGIPYHPCWLVGLTDENVEE